MLIITTSDINIACHNYVFYDINRNAVFMNRLIGPDLLLWSSEFEDCNIDFLRLYETSNIGRKFIPYPYITQKQ